MFCFVEIEYMPFSIFQNTDSYSTRRIATTGVRAGRGGHTPPTAGVETSEPSQVLRSTDLHERVRLLGFALQDRTHGCN